MKKIFFFNILTLGIIVYLFLSNHHPIFSLGLGENIFTSNLVFTLLYFLFFLLVLFSLLRNYKYVFSNTIGGNERQIRRFKLITFFCIFCIFLLYIFSLLAPITKYNYIQSDFTFSSDEPRGLRDPFFVKELKLIIQNPHPEESKKDFDSLMAHCRGINYLDESDKYCIRSIICSFSNCGPNLDCASVCTFILPNKSKK